ncbi:copper resistance protein B [Sphingobium faniae]|nr:copper resistance protein B [Sphingobium faniae]
MKMLAVFATLMLAFTPLPLWAQDDHGQMDHGQMDHGQMDHGQGQHHSAPPMPAQAAPSNDPHAGHGPAAPGDAMPKGAAPMPPADHAADAFYDRADMERARVAMLRENGGTIFSQFMLDRLEYQARKGADGYHWEGEGWIGGDIHRFAFKSEGEGEIGGPLERAEVQALYSRAIDPWFNLEAGLRHDIRPQPRRTYAVIGIEGLAPYWFEIGAQAFLSTKGDAHFRLEGSYDQRITQRLILQPAAEVNIAAQDVPELGIGSGPSDIELGLRLRYEFAREFAPYVGIHWERRLGDSAAYARAAGEDVSSTGMVMGIRFWF